MSELLSAAARATLDDLTAIVAPEGAHFVVREATASAVTVELDLSGSPCPECVLSHDLLIEILSTRLRESDPDVRTVELIDPRVEP